MNSYIFWDIPPCSLLKVNRRFRGTWKQVESRAGPACHLLSRWSLVRVILSTMKMEAAYTSKTSVDFQRTARRYIPEDRTLYNHCCENLRSYMNCVCLRRYSFVRRIFGSKRNIITGCWRRMHNDEVYCSLLGVLLGWLNQGHYDKEQYYGWERSVVPSPARF
jgi:hypothetical protein